MKDQVKEDFEKVYFSEHLHDELDENIVNANGDYTANSKKFVYRNKHAELVYITHLAIYIEDSTALDSGLYGSGITLTNGIRLEIETKDHGLQRPFGRQTIKKNSEWSLYTTEPYDMYNFGTGPYSITYRLDFGKICDYAQLEKGDVFKVHLNDDFTGLTGHKFIISGYTTNQDRH